MNVEKKKIESMPSYNRRAAAMKTLVEMMEGATPEQAAALSIAVSCVWRRERQKQMNRARRREAACGA